MTTGFDRDRDDFARGARAIVVLPDQGNASRDADARLAETAGLALAIGVEVVEKIAFRVRQPKPATLIGSGQVEQLAAQVAMEEAGLIVRPFAGDGIRISIGEEESLDRVVEVAAATAPR